MAQITIMDTPSFNTIKQLNSIKNQDLRVIYTNKKDKYDWIKGFLDKIRYKKLIKSEKKTIISFLNQVLPDESSHIYHLISKYLRGKLYAKEYLKKNPHYRYTIYDIKLLSEVDIAHKRLNNKATKRIIWRQYSKYGDKRFENLKNISPAHINNLRHRRTYDCKYKNGTKSVQSQIGERIKPEPNGNPGYLRIDTVHQRDVYYINAIDEVTQWEIVACVKAFSELFMQPILEMMIESFPFKIVNFHSDNGCEYINWKVSDLLNRLLIKQTKSRPRKSNDNALIECKNGCIIRKHMGYGYIAEKLAPEITRFCVDYFNPYLNFNRPCAFKKEKYAREGSKRKVYLYDEIMTPYEKFRSLPRVESFLKPGITLENLNKQELKYGDLDFAKSVKEEKCKLFPTINASDSVDFVPPVSLRS